MQREAAARPREHRGGDRGGELVDADEPAKDAAAHKLLELAALSVADAPQRNEGAIRGEAAVGDERVLMRHERKEGSKRLVAGDEGDFEVIAAGARADEVAGDAIEDLRQALVQTGIEAEELADALGKGEDPLAIGNPGQDLGVEPL